MRSNTTAEPSAAFARYERIQEFKRSGTAVIDGVNYANVIAIYLYDTSLVGWIKKLAFAVFFTTRTTVVGSGSDLLVYYSYRYKGRSDYDYIADQLTEIIGAQADIAETSESPSGTQWLYTARGLPSAIRASRGFRVGLAHRLGAAFLIAKYASTTQRSFRRLAADRRGVVTFCDAAPHDNLLAQMASNNGAHTVTAQHGQYRLLDEANMSPDAEAYANFVSDQLLCWGEATSAEFARFNIDTTRMAITGWIRRWDGSLVTGTNTGTFGVMLNGENGEASNAELIETAKQLATALNLEFIVRLHPAFTVDRYNSSVGNRCVAMAPMAASEYLAKVDFSLAHMSGAVIEMLQVESPIYVLDDGRLADAFRVPGLSYSGFEQLLAAIQTDREEGDRAQMRLRQLKHWYNDDADQVPRIRSVVFPEEA